MPGNFGCGSDVLAAMTILAPSFAAFNAMALPIPRLAPVMKMVFPASFLQFSAPLVDIFLRRQGINVHLMLLTQCLSSCKMTTEGTLIYDLPTLIKKDEQKPKVARQFC